MKRATRWAIVGALLGVALGQAGGRPAEGAAVGALSAGLIGHWSTSTTSPPPAKALGATSTSDLLLQEARFRSRWTEGAPVKSGADALLAVLTAFGKARWETPSKYVYWRDQSAAAPEETNWRSVDPALTMKWGIERLSAAPNARRWLLSVLAPYNQAAAAKLQASAQARRDAQVKAAQVLAQATAASQAARRARRAASRPASAPAPTPDPASSLAPEAAPESSAEEAGAGLPNWALPVGAGVATLVLVGLVALAVRP